MSRNSQNSEDSVEYAISVETRVVAYSYEERQSHPTACDHMQIARPHSAQSTSIIKKAIPTIMIDVSILKAIVDDWPNVGVGTTWGLVAIPIATLVACCLWLRVFWPSRVQQYSGKISNEQLKDYCNKAER